ncbi:MAG: hypothetical protein M1823_000958 [Watsoniomyces obsoletus]|nr:MAG: hypothetical protein M1823_000958 [Watsoniomyces obsoletus]
MVQFIPVFQSKFQEEDIVLLRVVGHQGDQQGPPPLSVDALLSSANFTLSLLPVRLAHRIQALRNLPFIVVSNPHVSTIYGNYLHSLSALLPFTRRPITTLQEESTFTEVLADLVQTHANTIPVLARGFAESRRYISPADVTRFLDEHLRARIGTRLIAEQHIALHYESRSSWASSSASSSTGKSSSSSTTSPNGCGTYIGVIDTALKPASVIEDCAEFVADICELRYGVRPSVVIDGQPETTFAFVPVHLEYIVTELLKNAFRAVVEAGNEREPVVVTIAAAPDDPHRHPPTGNQDELELPRVSEKDAPDPQSMALPLPNKTSNKAQEKKAKKHSAPAVTIRLRDRGGGIAPENLSNIWSYSFSTFSEPDSSSSSSSSHATNRGAPNMHILSTLTQPHHHHHHPLSNLSHGGQDGAFGGSSIAGLGYGLPLSRAYAEYFGGRIELQNIWGWGADVYLVLRGVGRQLPSAPFRPSSSST